MNAILLHAANPAKYKKKNIKYLKSPNFIGLNPKFCANLDLIDRFESIDNKNLICHWSLVDNKKLANLNPQTRICRIYEAKKSMDVKC